MDWSLFFALAFFAVIFAVISQLTGCGLGPEDFPTQECIDASSCV